MHRKATATRRFVKLPTTFDILVRSPRDEPSSKGLPAAYRACALPCNSLRPVATALETPAEAGLHVNERPEALEWASGRFSDHFFEIVRGFSGVGASREGARHPRPFAKAQERSAQLPEMMHQNYNKARRTSIFCAALRDDDAVWHANHRNRCCTRIFAPMKTRTQPPTTVAGFW